METINQLEPLLKTYWYIAIPASLIFIIQTIMAFAGAAHSDGFDGGFHAEHDGFQLFSFKNLINFLLGLSWAGISLRGLIANDVLLIAVSVAVGVGFVGLFFFIIQQVQRLAEDNSFQLASTLDKQADVYLKIPANRKGRGKVLVSVKGTTHELDAMTDGPEIPSNAKAKVVGVEDGVLIVQAI